MNLVSDAIDPHIEQTSVPPRASQRRDRVARVLWLTTLGGWVLYVVLLIYLVVAFGDRPHVQSLLLPWFLQSLAMGPATAVLGYLIVTRRTEHAIGFILIVIGLAHTSTLLVDVYGSLSWQLLEHPLPLARWIVWLPWSARSPALELLGLVFLLFPSGRLPSRLWLPLAWVVIAQATLHFLGSAFGAYPYYFTWGEWITVEKVRVLPDAVVDTLRVLPDLADRASRFILPLCLLALVARYQRATKADRRQITWVLVGGALFYVFLFHTEAIGGLLGLKPDPPECAQCIPWAWTIGLCSLPACVAVAVFRHRLWATDVVINKAIVFSTLTAFVGGTYVLIVVVVGRLIGNAGESHLGLSIAATAIVAVAFQAVRERVTLLANRIVYGERATPYEALSAFARQIQGALSLHDVLPRMAEETARGLGAHRVAVRLVLPGGEQRIASWPNDTTIEADHTIPVIYQSERLGEIAVQMPPGTAFGTREMTVLEDLAAQAGLAMHNVLLTEELQHHARALETQAIELRASRERIVVAQDEQRRRIERDLHDGAQQRLIGLGLKLRMLEDSLNGSSPVLTQQAEQARNETTKALEELRDLARGLHPSVLTDEGLRSALEYLAERSPFPVTVVCDERRLSKTIEATVYFVVSEALANVSKYATASHVSVDVRVSDRLINVEVRDDGIGGANPSNGTGLRGLTDRVAALDGIFTVESPAGRGTVVRAEIPCA